MENPQTRQRARGDKAGILKGLEGGTKAQSSGEIRLWWVGRGDQRGLILAEVFYCGIIQGQRKSFQLERKRNSMF